jgi:hypothetical protein
MSFVHMSLPIHEVEARKNDTEPLPGQASAHDRTGESVGGGQSSGSNCIYLMAACSVTRVVATKTSSLICVSTT